ncbi:MAG: hypothetical protein COA94_00635 [Rickettsiales bacterium]|nr:MAG: hypothetical protein COA94_00635 [Rickettsiales bacterium]
MLENTIEYQINFWQAIAAHYIFPEGGFAFTTKMSGADTNLLILTKQDLQTLKSILPEVTSFFEKHQVPWGINIVDNPHSAEIISFLEEKHFSKIYTQHQMETKLASLPQTPGSPLVREVGDGDLEMLKDWTKPVVSGFKIQGSKDADLYYKLNEIALSREDNILKHFVLYDGAQPLSSATLSIHGDVARLDNVSTMVEAQRKGNGRALVEYCISKARALGCKYIIFESSERGINLYRKMGFKEVAMSCVYSASKSSEFSANDPSACSASDSLVCSANESSESSASNPLPRNGSKSS